MRERHRGELPPPAGPVISPAPTAEEAAAIAAATEVLWPRPGALAEPAPRSRSWRFSGRWWTRPVAARRERPWR